jgi:hypothetical protein
MVFVKRCVHSITSPPHIRYGKTEQWSEHAESVRVIAG